MVHYTIIVYLNKKNNFDYSCFLAKFKTSFRILFITIVVTGCQKSREKNEEKMKCLAQYQFPIKLILIFLWDIWNYLWMFKLPFYIMVISFLLVLSYLWTYAIFNCLVICFIYCQYNLIVCSVNHPVDTILYY